MHVIKPAALTAALLFGLLVCADAWADNQAAAVPAAVPAPVSDPAAEAYAKLPVCQLNADGKSLQVQPCRTAPPQSPMPRRAVPQIIQPLTPNKQAATVPMPTPPKPATAPQLVPAPVPVTGCDAGGCTGANGVRYNNAGNGVVGPSGKVCSRAGATIQC